MEVYSVPSMSCAEYSANSGKTLWLLPHLISGIENTLPLTLKYLANSDFH